jgi:glycerophosphoryl diester phosphodiesterase
MALTEPVLVQGHRGARAHRRENTLPAFEYALEIGVDVLELDLAVTRDGVLVVSHDPYVEHARCQPIGALKESRESRSAIRTLTLDEVKQFDCGLPTLAEVFQMVTESPLPTARRVMFNVETKSFRDTVLNDYPVPPSEFARMWLDCVAAHGMLERSILQSFDWRTLIAAKALEPRVAIAVLTEDPKEDLVATAIALRPEWMSPRWDMPNVTRTAVDQLHELGVRMAAWTPNEASAWTLLVSIGVDSIITDDPAALLAHLGRPKAAWGS